MPAPGPTFRYQGTAIAQELVGGVLARTYVTDEAGRIVKVCDPDCGGSNPQYLVTWSGHGDALALWQIGTGGSLTLVNSFGYSTWGTPTVYNASGTPIAWTDPASLRFRFLYVGAYGVAWDDLGLGLGLQYMAARHYSPSLGRFLQPDSSAAEANLYGYAGGSPVTVVDPSGYAYGYYNVGRYYRIHRPTVRRAAYWGVSPRGHVVFGLSPHLPGRGHPLAQSHVRTERVVLVTGLLPWWSSCGDYRPDHDGRTRHWCCRSQHCGNPVRRGCPHRVDSSRRGGRGGDVLHVHGAGTEYAQQLRQHPLEMAVGVAAMSAFAAILLCAALLITSRWLILDGARRKRLSVGTASLLLGAVWASFPPLMQATIAGPYDWLAVAIGSTALFVSVSASARWFLDRYHAPPGDP